MKSVIKELHQGKNVQQNLKKYTQEALATYQAYSGLELTFSAYTLVEEIEEERNELTLQENEAISTVLKGLELLSAEGQVESSLLDDMKKLRKDITERMELLTAYVDRLVCYEYILNRMEYEYLPTKELNKRLTGIDEQAFMRRLQRFIFADKDQSAMQDKLRLVIGQIPVRMTSDKFFEKIKESLSLYKGSEKKALEDFIYILRTSGMLYEPKQKIDFYQNFADDFDKLEQANYTELDENQYKELVDVLSSASNQIHELTDFYYSLQNVVNNIYAQCIIRTYMPEENKLDNACRAIWKCLANREYRPEMLVPLEGRIENQIEECNQIESMLYEVKTSYNKEIKEDKLEKAFEDVTCVSNLMSDSLFIDLEQITDEELADADFVKEKTEALLEEFSAKLKSVNRPMKRAIMGEVLEKLPMIFKSADEVLSYIQSNLFGCQNKAEKCIVISLVDDLMRQEEEWS